MSFPAKHPSRCGMCDDPITPGQLVRYEDDELIHDEHTLPELGVVGRGERLCGECWLIHAGGCA